MLEGTADVAAPEADASLEGRATEPGDAFGQPPDKSALASLTHERLESRIPSNGWEIVSKPTSTGRMARTYSVRKGTQGGMVQLNEFDHEISTKAFLETIQKNKDIVIHRDGNKILAVLLPGKRQDGQALLDALLR